MLSMSIFDLKGGDAALRSRWGSAQGTGLLTVVTSLSGSLCDTHSSASLMGTSVSTVGAPDISTLLNPTVRVKLRGNGYKCLENAAENAWQQWGQKPPQRIQKETFSIHW